MKRLTTIAALIIAALIIAGCSASIPCEDDILCQTATVAPTGTEDVTEIPLTGQPIATATPSSTPTVAIPTLTASPTPDPSPTPIATWPEDLIELLINPNFDEPFVLVTVDFSGIGSETHRMAPGWFPAYKGLNYHFTEWPALNLCQEGQTTGCNPILDENGDPAYQRRPEIRESDVENRVKSGYSQYGFCAGGTCTFAFYQIVQLTLGDVCRFSAYAQIWSAGNTDELGRTREHGIVGWSGDIPLYNPIKRTSDIATEDDRRSAKVNVFVSHSGKQDAFSSGSDEHPREVSSDYGYPEIYDRFAQVHYQFIVKAEETMVGVQVEFLWPHPHNDFMIDNASLTCLSAQGE